MPHAPTYDVGRYWGKVTHQRLGETSNGNYQLILSFSVLGMVNLSDPDGDLLRCPQGERSVYRVLTENTLEFAKQDMDVLGWYGSKWSQFDEENPDFVSIIGEELAFFCKHEPRRVKDESGNWVNTSDLREVWSIAQTGGPMVKPLDQQKIKSLDTMFGRALKDRKRPDGAKVDKPFTPLPKANGPKPLDKMTPAETKQEAATESDSVIPF